MSHAVLKVFPTLFWAYLYITLPPYPVSNDRWSERPQRPALIGRFIHCCRWVSSVCVCVCVSEEIWAYREFTSWLLLCFLRCLSSACRLDSAVTVRSSSSVTMTSALLFLALFSAASASHLFQRGKVPGWRSTTRHFCHAQLSLSHHAVASFALVFIFFLIAPEHIFLLFFFIITLLTLNNLIFSDELHFRSWMALVCCVAVTKLLGFLL